MKGKIKQSLLVQTALVFPALYWATVASAADNSEITFDSEFLKLSDGNNAKNIDLGYFAKASGAAPGKYTVDVILNGKLVDRQVDVDFIAKNNMLVSKTSLKELERWGVNTQQIPASEKNTSAIYITQIIKGASECLDTNNQRLILNIPQTYLKPQDWLSTPPHLWDYGMSALMVNYQFNGMEQNSNGHGSRNQFLSVGSSLNLGGWRLRQNGNWSTNSYDKSSHWQPVSFYLQHDYSFLQGGQFIIGRSSTDSTIFESFPFEGAQFSSDNGMIAPELSQYSPVVRGIAYSQAQVSVKQNGVIIYQKNVPPGPFELRDFSQSLSGDLDVEIREADGSIRRYTQSSAQLPILQRQGRLRYNVAFGKYHSNSIVSARYADPQFIQSSAALGLPEEYTIYGGAIKADNYAAAMLGIGKYSYLWGAFSVDATHAKSNLTQRSGIQETQQGQSYRIMYSRGFGRTNTTLNITGYRYATRGYYSFDELQQLQHDYLSPYSMTNYHQRSRISTTLNQDLLDWGQVNLSASSNQYWDFGAGYNLSASYSLPFRMFSAMVSVGYNKNPYQKNADKSLFLSVSIPFNSLLRESNQILTTNTINTNGLVQQQVGLSGSFKDGELSYAISQGWQNKSRGDLKNLNLNYRGSYAQMNGGYARQKQASQWIYGIGGGITLHPHGITLSQPLSLDAANALVYARDSPNIKVLSGKGIYTDRRGFAVVPNLNPYNRNQVSLDVNSVKDNVELVNTDVTVIPNRGALVPASFKVNVGNKAIITLIQKNGTPVPFGSMVTLDSEFSGNSSIVADEGQVYMSGLPKEGTLIAKWGENLDQRCKVKYKLREDNIKIKKLTVRCQ